VENVDIVILDPWYWLLVQMKLGTGATKKALWIAGPVKGSGDQFHQVRELVGTCKI